MAERTNAPPESRLSPKWRDRISLLAVLAAGFSLTLLAGNSLQQAEALRVQERLSAATHLVVSTLNLELARTTEAVRTAGLMLESNPQLTRDQFNNYMQKLVERQLSVNLMEWQPIVPANQLAQFEAAARTAGQPGFQVVQPDASGAGWEPVHGRDEYVPVLFAWPEKYRTEGLDMSFSPQRMTSKLQSRTVGRPVASGSFEFMKEGMVNSGSVAVAISTTVFGADHAAKGYLAAVVDLPTLFQSATRLADLARLDFFVFASATPESVPIFASHGNGSDLKQANTGLRLATIAGQRTPVDFAHQSWTLVLHPRPAFYAETQEIGSRLTFVVGMGMTLLIAIVLFQLQISRRKTERAESAASRARLEQEALSQQLKEAQRIARVGSWQLDVASGRVVWSEELYRIHGLNPGLPPPDDTEHARLFTPESWTRLSAALPCTLETGDPYELELEMVRPDGSRGWMLARGEAIRDASGSIAALRGTAAEITERKRLEDQVRQMAFCDTLTNLPNRRLLNDRLAQSFAANKRSNSYGALMFIDLDNFKPLNDAYGHGVGDLLLIEAASRLKSCVREMDTVARIGGDEFVVMLSELNLDKATATVQAGHVAEKILAALSIPYLLAVTANGRPALSVQYRCTASIGVAVFNNHESSQDDILKCADAAMYQAKESGRNSIRFYEAKT